MCGYSVYKGSPHRVFVSMLDNTLTVRPPAKTKTRRERGLLDNPTESALALVRLAARTV